MSYGKGFWEVLPPEIFQEIAGYVVDDLLGGYHKAVHIVGVPQGLHAVPCCPKPDMDYLRRVDNMFEAATADAPDENRYLAWRRRGIGQRAMVSPFRNGHLSCQMRAIELGLGEPGPLWSCLRVCQGLEITFIFNDPFTLRRFLQQTPDSSLSNIRTLKISWQLPAWPVWPREVDPSQKERPRKWPGWYSEYRNHAGTWRFHSGPCHWHEAVGLMSTKLGGLTSLTVRFLKWQNDRPYDGKFSVPSWGGNEHLDRDVLAALLRLPFPTVLATSTTTLSPMASSRPPPPQSNNGGAMRGFFVEMEEPVVCHVRLADFVRDGPFRFSVVPRSEIAWVVGKYCQVFRMPTEWRGGHGRRPEPSFAKVEAWARLEAERNMADHPYFASALD